MNTSYDKFIRTTDADMIELESRKFSGKCMTRATFTGANIKECTTECESFYTESQLVDGKMPGGRLVKPTGKYSLKMINIPTSRASICQPGPGKMK